MNLGDVYWVDLPGRRGHAQAGRRPAIIAQSVEASAQLATVLVVPLTTQQDALRFPGTVLIEPDVENGLRGPSIALVFQLTALDRRLVTERLGTASDVIISSVWSALDDITDRSPAVE